MALCRRPQIGQNLQKINFCFSFFPVMAFSSNYSNWFVCIVLVCTMFFSPFPWIILSKVNVLYLFLTLFRFMLFPCLIGLCFSTFERTNFVQSWRCVIFASLISWLVFIRPCSSIVHADSFSKRIVVEFRIEDSALLVYGERGAIQIPITTSLS